MTRLKDKLKNSDFRQLLENFISLSSLQVVSIFLPLLTLPYLLRILGESNYGIVVLSVSLINYFISVTDYSFRVSATREVSINRTKKKQIDLIYSEVMTIKLFLLLVSILVLLLVVVFYEPFYKERTVFFLTIPMLIGYVIFPEWFFQGIEKMKYITILNISVKIFFTICIFIFIKNASDYILYPLIQSIGYLSVGFIAQIILLRKYKVKLYWIGYSRIKKGLSQNFPLFVNQFMPTLYNNTGVLLLGIFGGTSQAGIYDAIKKVIDVIVVMINVVSRVFFPFLNRVKSSFIMYKKMMTGLGIFVSLVPILASSLIISYLNITYQNAFTVLSILSLGIFFLTLYELYGLNYFIIERQDKLVMRNTIMASVIGFVLAFPLIISFGIIGAAINLTLSRFLMGGGLYLQYIYSVKNLKPSS